MDLSIIIPAYNCENTIDKLLNSLSYQETEFSYEIIVVDNDSTDSTPEIIESYQKNFTVPLITIKQPHGVTISAVRNSGVKSSQGRVLAFIDSDCEPPNDWVQNGMLQLQLSQEPALLAGGCTPPKNGTWVENAWHSTRSGHKEGSVFVHGANFFISRTLFERIQGFDETIETCEDYDLGQRVSKIAKVIQAPTLSVVHYGEANTIIKKFTKEKWYSKNMGKILRNNYFYKPFWISFIFLIISLCLMSSLLTLNFDLALKLFSMLIVLSILLALFFCMRSNKFDYIVELTPICFAYLLGRSIGIIEIMIDKLRKINISKTNKE